MNNKTAFLTGITGQDGSYLAEILLKKGYNVYGLVRRLSKPNTENIYHIMKDITLMEGDLLDQSSLNSVVRKLQPDEVYNLAAQSFVGTSWTQPVLTGDVTGLGALRVFEALRSECQSAKVYQASSSEMFGNTKEYPQNENTAFYPRSPYGVAKVFAHHTAINYRESYDMFITCGILFNHESPRRGVEFVTKKITTGVANIVKGLHKYIELGNIEAKRDWGYAPEYMEAVWKMMQLNHPDTFIIATCETHSVKEFVEEAFNQVGLKWEQYVKLDSKYIRPAEVNNLCGDYSKAKKILGWEPKIKFKDLVRIMVDFELQCRQKNGT